MIALGRQTGYDIKQFVDKSTRHFWAASYGQIYPELRRLEEQGLIVGQSEPTGGRARTVYELTDAGRAAFEQWLAPDPDPAFEVRDESMLKLFFSDVGTPEQRIRNVRAMRESHERTLAQLSAHEEEASHMPEGPRLTLELGIRLHRGIVEWCESTERRLREEAADAD
ncbi:MAG TPA: PadR family transcriptional regulator [Solirubrobacteraceae bacterium]|jgi:PadR family transcriptional regulator AphA|nr:PadR family transcriptional regulator [Solirubrobacteraceae bacterium]